MFKKYYNYFCWRSDCCSLLAIGQDVIYLALGIPYFNGYKINLNRVQYYSNI